MAPQTTPEATPAATPAEPAEPAAPAAAATPAPAEPVVAPAVEPATPASEPASLEPAEAPPAADVWVTDLLDEGEPSVPEPTPAEPIVAVEPAPAPVVVPEPPVEPVPPAAPVTPAEPVAPVAAVEPVVEPAPAPALAPAEPVTPAEPQLTEAQRKEQIEAWRGTLAANYQMSDDDAAKLITAPNEVLPQLAARLYTDVYQEVQKNIMSTLAKALPNFVRQQIQATTTSDKNETKFYDMWPELKEHATLVNQVSDMYQKVNKDFDIAKFTKDVGTQVWISLGMPHADLLSKLADKPAEPAAPVEVPATPAAPVPGMNPAPGGPVTPAAPAETNVFTELAEEIIRDGI